jgi:probable F420-dependent oxidoreductase
MDLKSVGIWTGQLDYQPASRAQEAVAELEELGYGAVWVGEAVGREALSNAGLLLSVTRRLVVATGIANIWVRDALAMVAGQYTLAEAYPERFLLGLGVSHAPLIEEMRGHHYQRPLAAMRQYLNAMDEVVGAYRAVPPATPPPRVLAALGPKMLALAAEQAQGAHSYFVPPEHTAQARHQLGPEPWLIPEQAVILENDPEPARELARRHTSRYLQLPNYTNNLRRLGFDDEDLAGSGSDRLVDAVVAWGDEETIGVQRFPG